jgi:signal transduction histidine kinase
LIGHGQAAAHSGVAVILDVDLQNYHFTTQPGALRRLIMNLLGNALKYTSHGYVWIKLDATDMEDLPQSTGTQESGDSVPRSSVVLTVTDTGKGISADFLRSKLFMPFAQENSLSSGTGLGLSIVRKIVSLLEGGITIDSEVGRGTRRSRKVCLAFSNTNSEQRSELHFLSSVKCLEQQTPRPAHQNLSFLFLEKLTSRS